MSALCVSMFILLILDADNVFMYVMARTSALHNAEAYCVKPCMYHMFCSAIDHACMFITCFV